jgi:hypothetical protein
MSYQDDYEKISKEAEAVGRHLLSLQRRMAALQVLIAEGKPGARSKDQDSAATVLEAFTAPRIADRIRGILAASSPAALTVREIRDELRHAGTDLSKQSNPAGTIGSVCASLVDQGFALAQKKDGRNAWKKR